MNSSIVQAMIGSAHIDVNSFEGYMATKGLSMMGLIIGIYLAFLASGSLAGEIERKTMDLHLSLPLSREHMVLSKSLAIVPIIVLIGIAQLLAIYLSALYIHHNVAMIWFAYVVLSISLLDLAAGALAMVVSAFMDDGKKAVLVTIGIFIAMYFIETIGSVVSSINWLRTFSLFHYQEVSGILATHTVTWSNMLVLLAVASILMALAIYVFKQRDINLT